MTVLRSLRDGLIIEPSRLRLTDCQKADPAIQRGELQTTPVEIHFHGQGLPSSACEPQFAKEVHILLHCRHPNVQLMIGFSPYPDGHRLVMERVWGSVSAALSSEPLGTASATEIAAQVASAVEFVHQRHIFHGSIGIDSAMLLSHPGMRPVTAKLGNFAFAKWNIHDQTILAADVRALIVFIYNLFTTKPIERVEHAPTGLEVSGFDSRYLADFAISAPSAQVLAEMMPGLPEVVELVTVG